MSMAEEVASSGIYGGFAITSYSSSQLCCGAHQRFVLFDSDSYENGRALLGDVHLAEAARYFTHFQYFFVTFITPSL